MKYANNKYKTPKDTSGYRENCLQYNPCPLCYGCRNYGCYPFTCDDLCGRNKKINICKTQLHTPQNIAKMVRRNKIIISQEDTSDARK